MRALLLISFLLMASCDHKDAAQQALSDARRLTAQGDYEAALAKHVWYHDNALKVNAGYYGVRLSYALGDWVQLGKQYPPALEKLRSICDGKTARILAGETNRDLFVDVAAINHELGNPAATVELFKRIDAANPTFGASIFEAADNALVEASEFALDRKYLRDTQERLVSETRFYDQCLQTTKKSKRAEAGRRACEANFSKAVVRTITILEKTGDHAGALSVQTEALKSLDSAVIRDATY